MTLPTYMPTRTYMPTVVYIGAVGGLGVLVTGVTVTAVTAGLPGLRVEWEQVSPGDAEFVEYGVYRRRAAHTGPFGEAVAAGLWTRIARPAALTITSHTDYAVGSGLDYEYAVTWRGIDGGITLESERQAAPVDGVVTWRGGYLHDPADSAVYTLLLASELAVEQQQEMVDVAVRGRRAGATFVGERFERAYDLGLNPEVLTSEQWQRLRTMLDRQFSQGSIYCLRLGHSGEMVFGTLRPISRNDRTGLTTPAMRLLERSYEEAV